MHEESCNVSPCWKYHEASQFWHAWGIQHSATNVNNLSDNKCQVIFMNHMIVYWHYKIKWCLTTQMHTGDQENQYLYKHFINREWMPKKKGQFIGLRSVQLGGICRAVSGCSLFSVSAPGTHYQHKQIICIRGLGYTKTIKVDRNVIVWVILYEEQYRKRGLPLPPLSFPVPHT